MKNQLAIILLTSVDDVRINIKIENMVDYTICLVYENIFIEKLSVRVRHSILRKEL